jgi:hypothetical protein
MTDTTRAAFTAGLRQFADWIDANPDVTAPTGQRFLLPLHTNQAVTDFAAEHGLTATADAEGNLSADIEFGPIAYQAYGYTDFNAHRDACNERTARRWAAEKGLELVEKTTA